MSIMLEDETELVSRAQIDATAFAALYDYYFPRVYNYVRYRVGNYHDADDLTSQIFEQVLDNMCNYYSERGSFAGWLFSIAHNIICDYFQKRTKDKWVSIDSLFNLISNEPDPQECVIANMNRQELLKGLGKLTDRQRNIIALKFWAGLTNRYISSITGLSESNVGVILYRAIRQLRTTMMLQRDE